MEQWWITGFVPNIRDYSITDEELVLIASIDFSENTEMYEAIKVDVESEDEDVESKREVIFDDKYNIIWLIW